MSAPLWTGEALVERACTAVSTGAMPAAVTGISIDTRTLAPGDAFFAIQGEARDGHDFVAAALAKGAGLAVVDRGSMPKPSPARVRLRRRTTMC